jgi:hypothetical protein
MRIQHTTKQIILAVFSVVLFVQVSPAQTNTFPATGNVGIGTTSPVNALDVGAAATGAFNGTAMTVSSTTGVSTVGVGQSPTARGRMKWHYNATEANAFISLSSSSGTHPLILQDLGGNVGIGTTGPLSLLNINTTAVNGSPALTISGGTGSGSNVGLLDFYSNSGTTVVTRLQTTRNGANNSGQLDFHTANLGTLGSRMTILPGGNVGIGTTTPGYLLDVSGTARINAGGLSSIIGSTAAYWNGFKSNAATGVWGFQQSERAFFGVGGNLYNRGFSANAISLFNGSTTAEDVILYNKNSTDAGFLVLKDSGNVGVGVVAPTYKLDVNGEINATGFRINGTPISAGGSSQWSDGANSTIHYNSGNVGIGTASPIYSLDVNGGGNGFRAKAATTSSSDAIATFENSSGVQAIVRGNGNVGIGTASPGKKLDIRSAEIRFGNYTDDTGLTKTDSISNTFYISRSSGSSEGTSIGPGYSHKAMITTGETSSWIVDTGAMLMLRSLYTTLGNADYPYTRPSGNVEFYYKRPGSTASPFTSSTKFYDDTTTLPAYVNFKPELGFILNSTGNVGIGTGAPNYKLDVNGEINATGIRINGTPISGGGGSQWSNGTNSIYYNAGNVGLGTGDPAEKLEVAGSVYISGANYLRFPHAYGDANDGKIGNSMFASGLNLVGINNDNTFRKIQLWGQITQNQNDGTNSWAGTNYFSGNVGIGNNSPSTKLQVAGGTRIDGTSGRVYLGTGAVAGSRGLEFIEENATTFSIRHHDPNVAWQNIVINPYAGKVGIGTLTPTEALEVGGNIKASGTIFAKYQDLAEWVPSSEQLSAGTVVVLDTTKSNQVISSTISYDTRVAGVISAQPGITLGEGGEGKVLVATTGRVRVKVDASRGPIQIGDLLVTSDVSGVAMKSEAVNLGGVQIHRPGTIIGKALEPLAKGKGEILVLLSLQ